MPRIQKDDTVVAISGAGAGKTGKVLQVLRAKNRALVEGLNQKKKTLRKSQDNPQGGIVDKEAPMELSNLLLYCPNCKKGVKVSRGKDGARTVRRCRVCKHPFDG